ncbi:MAG TPA: helix-turn-helix domain-containing protein [Actinomycetes bacterium]
MQDRSKEQAALPPLLTARQVQGMLGVDRSTVYRMADDGRIPALKVGRQWRFPLEQIERLLVVGPRAAGSNETPAACLPVGTVASVLAVAAELLGVMMVVTDMGGRPLSGVANPCPWFIDKAEDPDTFGACVAEWKLLADELDFEPQFRTGPLGFDCARAHIRSGTVLVGMVLAGGLAPPGNDSRELYQLDEAARRRVLASLPKVAAAISRAIPPPPRPATPISSAPKPSVTTGST